MIVVLVYCLRLGVWCNFCMKIHIVYGLIILRRALNARANVWMYLVICGMIIYHKCFLVTLNSKSSGYNIIFVENTCVL